MGQRQDMSKNEELFSDARHEPTRNVAAEKVTFRLLSQQRAIVARGIRRKVAAGAADTLASRVGSHFAALPDGPQIVVGALPFDRTAPDFLFQPDAIIAGEEAKSVSGARRVPRTFASRWLVAPEPSAEAYRLAVAAALALMNGRDDLNKVVLSRSLSITADAAIDIEGLFEKLAADGSVTSFLTCLPDDRQGSRMLVGATPELLVAKSGSDIVSHPLAGSARRHGDPVLDRSAGLALQRSDKDRREHRAVVEAVLDTLNPYCAELCAPDPEALTATATMWHLGTRIVGRLKDRSVPVVELAAALHPTPAVCGLPRLRASDVISELENYDRGFYAGAVGWADAKGDGNWFVSLRCAEIVGSRARLYAGAGIVPGSDPVAEADETSAKFLAMLKALGVDEQGRAIAGKAA